MRTAMQELLRRFKKVNQSGWVSLDELEQEILDFGIPTEKMQIEQTWWAANREGVRNFLYSSQPPKNAANLYYNETYGNEAAAAEIEQV